MNEGVRTFIKKSFSWVLIFQLMTIIIILQYVSTYKTPFLKWKHTESKISIFRALKTFNFFKIIFLSKTQKKLSFEKNH